MRLLQGGEGGEDFLDRGAVAVGGAHLGVDDRAGLVEDEGGGVGGFFWSVPAEAVEVGEGVVGVEEHFEEGGETFVRGELLGLGLHDGGWARIDKQDAGLGAGESGGVIGQFFHLARTEGALVAGKAAEEDEDNGALRGFRDETDGVAFQVLESEVRGVGTEGWSEGERREGDG